MAASLPKNSIHCLLIEDVDRHQAKYARIETRADALEQLVARCIADPHRSTSSRIVPYSAFSLRHVAVNLVRQHLAPGYPRRSPAVETFWREGSTCLDKEYLGSIGFQIGSTKSKVCCYVVLVNVLVCDPRANISADRSAASTTRTRRPRGDFAMSVRLGSCS